jgi:threonylcarbamoyladenosine tRNA methylthiotransferase MtaB
MKRRHNREMVLDFCKKMRSLRPEISFGSDVIAGFPTETEEMFENSARLLLESDIVFNHIFTYSEREGTFAAIMRDQVPKSIRVERTKKLISQTAWQVESFLRKMLGKEQMVIVETDLTGRAENFAQVRFTNLDKIKETGRQVEGQIFATKILGVERDTLIGEAIIS